MWAMALIFMSMSECSNKQLTADPPFDATAAYFQKWVAGVEMGGSGVNLIIPMSKMKSGVQIDSVYFRGQRLALATKPGDDATFVAYLVNPKKPDMTMSDEEGAEYGNPVPALSNKYKLQPNEAVIKYQYGGKTYYTKISEIAERDQVNYPSMPNPDGGS